VLEGPDNLRLIGEDKAATDELATEFAPVPYPEID
jgi:hypothetical protein